MPDTMKAKTETVRPIRTRDRQPGGSPTRTARISDPIWKAAQKRAKKDGVSMSQLMSTLVEGYAKGKIDMPRVELVYEDKTKASA